MNNKEWGQLYSRNGRRAVLMARSRAKKKSIPFNIDYDYVLMLMPKDMIDIFGGQMRWKGEPDGSSVPSKQSPSLDRIDPFKGYVKGNVQWLTQEHNLMKQQFTHAQLIEKIQCLLRNLE